MDSIQGFSTQHKPACVCDNSIVTTHDIIEDNYTSDRKIATQPLKTSTVIFNKQHITKIPISSYRIQMYHKGKVN